MNKIFNNNYKKILPASGRYILFKILLFSLNNDYYLQIHSIKKLLFFPPSLRLSIYLFLSFSQTISTLTPLIPDPLDLFLLHTHTNTLNYPLCCSIA